MFKLTIKYFDIYKGIINQLTNVSKLWREVTPMMDRATNDLFDNQGGTWGIKAWVPLSSKMYGKVRVGTDGKTYGFYNEGSRLLQASGGYRDSFRKISQRPLRMVYGSNYRFKGGAVSGDVIPFAGRGAAAPRFPQPDVESGRFRSELARIEQRFLEDVITRSIVEAAEVRR